MAEQTNTIKNLPKTDRPREKLIAKGAGNLKDEELLAILLGTGIEGKNAVELARAILAKYPRSKLVKLNFTNLAKIKGIGPAKACQILASQELVKRCLVIKDELLPVLSSLEDVVAQAIYMKNKSREHFMVISLNGRNEMLYKKPLFVGTLNANLVHPREVFQEAISRNAASIILAHNHPTGNAQPSRADIEITQRLVKAGKIMGIEVQDHIIITKSAAYSFKENKLI